MCATNKEKRIAGILIRMMYLNNKFAQFIWLHHIYIRCGNTCIQYKKSLHNCNDMLLLNWAVLKLCGANQIRKFLKQYILGSFVTCWYLWITEQYSLTNFAGPLSSLSLGYGYLQKRKYHLLKLYNKIHPYIYIVTSIPWQLILSHLACTCNNKGNSSFGNNIVIK